MKRRTRSTPPVSLGIRTVVFFTKVAVLAVSAVLEHKEAQSWYRHWRGWLDPRATDPARPITAWKLLRDCIGDFILLLPDVLKRARLESAIYNLIDQPMQGLVFWAFPAGSVSAVSVWVLGASQGSALFAGFIASSLTWLVYIGYRLRQRINDGFDEPERVVSGDPTRRATLSNVVSSARLLLSPPLLIWAVLSRRFDLLVGVLAASLASDWLDGFLARKRDEITDLGKTLDRWADRAVVLALAGSLLFIDVGPTALLALALLRDVLVGSATIGLSLLDKKPAPVSCAGKLGFALLITGLILYLLVEADLGWLPRDGSLGHALHVGATATATIGLGLRYLSGWQQFRLRQLAA